MTTQDKKIKVVNTTDFNNNEIENAKIDVNKNEIINLPESGKVDDVLVNGQSVVENKIASVQVPTKLSELENDGEYINNNDIKSLRISTLGNIANTVQKDNFNLVNNNAIAEKIDESKITAVDSFIYVDSLSTLPNPETLGQKVLNTFNNKIYTTVNSKEINSDYTVTGNLNIDSNGIIRGFTQSNYLTFSSNWWHYLYPLKIQMYLHSNSLTLAEGPIFIIYRSDDNSPLFDVKFTMNGGGSDVLTFTTYKRDGTVIETYYTTFIGSKGESLNTSQNYILEMKDSPNFEGTNVSLTLNGAVKFNQNFKSLTPSTNIDDDFYYNMGGYIKLTSIYDGQYGYNAYSLINVHGINSYISKGSFSPSSKIYMAHSTENLVWDDEQDIQSDKLIFNIDTESTYRYDGTNLNKITTLDYNDLNNKPTIGDASLILQKNSTDIGIFTANATNSTTIDIEVPTKTSDLTNDSDYQTSTEVVELISDHNTTNTSHSDIREDVTHIESLIPGQASSTNQLADKNFVNSSITTNTANFIGTFNSVADLEAYSGTLTNNDYAFVINTDAAGNTSYDRYKYNGDTQEWLYEYTLNNSSFTSNQWAAINSGITDSKVSGYDNHLNNTNNPHSVTKSQVGLGDVNNTSDLDKPISTATQAALNNKVDKVNGKGLSTNDYTDSEKTKLAGIETGAQVNTVTGVKGDSEESYRTGNINITKANIGLGDVNNTSDLDKPISTATQAALNKKQDKLVAGENITIDTEDNRIEFKGYHYQVYDYTNLNIEDDELVVDCIVSENSLVFRNGQLLRQGSDYDYNATMWYQDGLAAKFRSYADLENWGVHDLPEGCVVKILHDENHDYETTYYEWQIENNSGSWVYLEDGFNDEPRFCTYLYNFKAALSQDDNIKIINGLHAQHFTDITGTVIDLGHYVQPNMIVLRNGILLCGENSWETDQDNENAIRLGTPLNENETLTIIPNYNLRLMFEGIADFENDRRTLNVRTNLHGREVLVWKDTLLQTLEEDYREEGEKIIFNEEIENDNVFVQVSIPQENSIYNAIGDKGTGEGKDITAVHYFGYNDTIDEDHKIIDTGIEFADSVYVYKNGVLLRDTIDYDINAGSSEIEFDVAIVSTDTITVINGDMSGIDMTRYLTYNSTATISNKTISANDNTISNLDINNFKSGVIKDTIRDSETATDTNLVTEKAVRTELDTKQENLIAGDGILLNGNVISSQGESSTGFVTWYDNNNFVEGDTEIQTQMATIHKVFRNGLLMRVGIGKDYTTELVNGAAKITFSIALLDTDEIAVE